MFVVISYDIPDDRRRSRVSGVLEGYGVRVQKSVFEVEVEERQYERLSAQVLREIQPDEDSVRYYHLCAGCRGRVVIQGLGKVHTNPPFYFV